MGEFNQEIIQEYTQSSSVLEEKTKYGYRPVSGSLWEKFLAGFHRNDVIKVVCKKVFDKIDRNMIETKVYDVPSDFTHKEIVKNSKRAFFRTTIDGAVDMAIHTSGDATVLVFQLSDHGDKRTKVMSFSAKNRELEESMTLLNNEQLALLADKEICSSEFTYLVSVWLDHSRRKQEQGDLITFRIGPHIDRMKHALGGMWVAGEISPETSNPASLIWYVPSQHIDSLIVNIDSLDDESEVMKTIQQAGGIVGDVLGAIGVAVSFAAMRAAASAVGGPIGFITGITGSFVYALVTFSITTIAPKISSIIEYIDEYKEDIKKDILKAAGKDSLSLSYGAYYNGVKLTLYFEDGILFKSPDYIVEPWNGDIMEGSPGQVGAFLPADEHMSNFGLTFQIIENQKKQDD